MRPEEEIVVQISGGPTLLVRGADEDVVAAGQLQCERFLSANNDFRPETGECLLTNIGYRIGVLEMLSHCQVNIADGGQM